MTRVYYYECTQCRGPVMRVVRTNPLLATALFPLLGLGVLRVAMKRGDGVCLDCDVVFDKRDVTHMREKIMPKHFDPEKYRAARRSRGTN